MTKTLGGYNIMKVDRSIVEQMEKQLRLENIFGVAECDRLASALGVSKISDAPSYIVHELMWFDPDKRIKIAAEISEFPQSHWGPMIYTMEPKREPEAFSIFSSISSGREYRDSDLTTDGLRSPLDSVDGAEPRKPSHAD